ncbi:aminoacyl-tRNA deacylase [Marinobacterium arenosum]|uniref:aminoacyl-tRNA deacylase n=1 Tax=Marinobacterium arenosum TaxID=2862496 RepID=UPI001C98CA12|nr:YbaK/EbsC family protein [Marinobacterium arenosum]MBY4677604.1 YbaK/EbsC family protein [Marinobacterium arenosum]
MSMSSTLEQYLSEQHTPYELISHGFSEHMLEAAHASQLPVKEVVKAVVLRDGDYHLLAAIPAMNKLLLPEVSRLMGRHLELAEENELPKLFGDCEIGAVPPVGEPFGMPIIWDDRLSGDEEIYFEAGDHRHLVHVSGRDYMKLLKNKPHGEISCAPEDVPDLSNY